MFAEFVSRYPTIKIIYVLSIRIHGFHVQALPFILSFLRKKRTYCLFLNPFGIYSIKCVHTLLHVYCFNIVSYTYQPITFSWVYKSLLNQL